MIERVSVRHLDKLEAHGRTHQKIKFQIYFTTSPPPHQQEERIQAKEKARSN